MNYHQTNNNQNPQNFMNISNNQGEYKHQQQQFRKVESPLIQFNQYSYPVPPQLKPIQNNFDQQKYVSNNFETVSSIRSETPFNQTNAPYIKRSPMDLDQQNQVSTQCKTYESYDYNKADIFNSYNTNQYDFQNQQQIQQNVQFMSKQFETNKQEQTQNLQRFDSINQKLDQYQQKNQELTIKVQNYDDLKQQIQRLEQSNQELIYKLQRYDQINQRLQQYENLNQELTNKLHQNNSQQQQAQSQNSIQKEEIEKKDQLISALNKKVERITLDKNQWQIKYQEIKHKYVQQLQQFQSSNLSTEQNIVVDENRKQFQKIKQNYHGQSKGNILQNLTSCMAYHQDSQDEINIDFINNDQINKIPKSPISKQNYQQQSQQEFSQLKQQQQFKRLEQRSSFNIPKEDDRSFIRQKKPSIFKNQSQNNSRFEQSPTQKKKPIFQEKSPLKTMISRKSSLNKDRILNFI